ncbi:MAG TPA: LamG domain-containing protein [Phycisphaerales bacterium]|nr:LamG domain-containing protein [Phycisphaerales bacterium]
MNMSSTPPTRRGSAYVLVLIVSAIAATIVVAGLSVRKDAADRGQRIDELASARLIAKSGIETVLQWGDENDEWRADGGASRTFNYTIGEGSVVVDVTDPSDGDLPDDEDDPYRLISTATLGGARALLRVDVSQPPVPDYRARVLAENPIDFWPLDDPAGSVKGQNLMGSQQTAYSNSSVAGTFSGNDARDAPWFGTLGQGAGVAHHDALLLDEGTIMCWAYCDDTIESDQTIIAKDAPGDDGDGHFRIYLSGNKPDLYVRFENNSTTTDLKVATFPIKQWAHVAVTFGPDGLLVYVDGTKEKQDIPFQTGLGPAAGGAGNTRPMLFGTWFDGSAYTDVLNGSVRDVVVFDRALTEAEINDLLTDPEPAGHAIDPDSWTWLTD